MGAAMPSNEDLLPPGEYRLRKSGGIRSAVSGSIVATRRHDHNGRPQYRLDFGIPAHQAMWGDVWFYADDLEAAHGDE
jgi:hypothetical protein